MGIKDLYTNKRKAIILFYTFVFLFFAIPYAIHLVKLASVATTISLRESEQEKRFDKLITDVRKEFEKAYPNDKFVFEDLYKIRKATIYTDTTVSFFIYSNTLTEKKLDLDYAKCLGQKASSEATKNIADRKLEIALNKLELEYGDLVSNLVSKIDRQKFFNQYSLDYCSNYYENNNTYDFNPNTIPELRRLLDDYTFNQQLIIDNNKNINQIYEDELNKHKVGLSPQEQKLLEKYLSDSNPIIEDYERFNFSSDRLGNFDYTIPAKVIDLEKIIDAINKINDEHYKNYSLKNGDMPYANCYGSANYGPSKIKINAGYGDVLITVKNLKNVVIRHVYVASNKSFTLKLPNGKYQVFFYYGDGWNPKRIMPKTTCDKLIGGFINNEFTNKDPEIVELYYSGIEYTLRVQTNGNFHTESCSKDEAF
jgi:hypothetical protein